MGVPTGGLWKELLNSDSTYYHGSGVGNGGLVRAFANESHGRPFSMTLALPPMGMVLLKPAE